MSCVKSKAEHACPAREIYVSPLFAGMRRVAESMADSWWILSAEHGLLHPDQVIAPYERTLAKMSTAERRQWTTRVEGQLVTRVGRPPDHVVVLAGERYRAPLLAWTAGHPTTLEIPMAGLAFGRQLQWLSATRPR